MQDSKTLINNSNESAVGVSDPALLIFLNHFFNLSQTAMAVMNDKGKMILLNPSFKNLLIDLELDEQISFFDLLDNADFKVIRELLDLTGYYGGSVDVKIADHGILSLECEITSIDANDTSYFIVTAKDVTEKLKTEEKVVQLQKMEALGRLSGGIAHDFNNILSIISLTCETMLLDSRIEEQSFSELMEGIRIIQTTSMRASQLTKQLLVFSRKQSYQSVPIDLAKQIRESVTMLKRTISEHINIEVRLPAMFVTIKADPVQIDQILLNLALNARDAMPEGGNLLIELIQSGTDEVLLGNESANPYVNYCIIKVSDTGSGMSEDTLEHIFEPFFTTKARGKGTGLGLSTVYGIVNHLDGFVKVRSELNKGTEFQIYLPVNENIEGYETGDKADDQDQSEKKSFSLLLVEDDINLRTTLKTVLIKKGFFVIDAFDGQDGLVKYFKYKHMLDFVLSDVIMPNKNGPEMLSEILKDNPNMNYLFMSGYTQNAIENNEIDFVDRLLVKPFQLSEMFNRLEALLGQCRQ